MANNGDFYVPCEIKNSPTQQPPKKEVMEFSHTAAFQKRKLWDSPHSSLPKKEGMEFSHTAVFQMSIQFQ